jgi:CubicO group peptidase (beta-lactamase class C family)
VTKSVTSALVGIALGEHILDGLDQPSGPLLARHLPPKADPRLRKATLEQLLTMTAGLPPDPPDGTPPGLVQASDWVRFVLSQHPASTPGARFAYSSDGSHLLSAILADAAGQPPCAMPRPSCWGRWGSPVTIPSSRCSRSATRRPISGPASPGRLTPRATSSAMGS